MERERNYTAHVHQYAFLKPDDIELLDFETTFALLIEFLLKNFEFDFKAAAAAQNPSNPSSTSTPTPTKLETEKLSEPNAKFYFTLFHTNPEKRSSGKKKKEKNASKEKPSPAKEITNANKENNGEDAEQNPPTQQKEDEDGTDANSTITASVAKESTMTSKKNADKIPQRQEDDKVISKRAGPKSGVVFDVSLDELEIGDVVVIYQVNLYQHLQNISTIQTEETCYCLFQMLPDASSKSNPNSFIFNNSSDNFNLLSQKQAYYVRKEAVEELKNVYSNLLITGTPNGNTLNKNDGFGKNFWFGEIKNIKYDEVKVPNSSRKSMKIEFEFKFPFKFFGLDEEALSVDNDISINSEVKSKHA